ncbi:MAG: hypothetical protein JSU64_04990 [candidate division WOR-3 bacterium]|nr:MAG: hypothetical protein JSU64_04990 [candidate division WOR-3 bacterium]
MKRRFPLLLVFILGILGIMPYFVPHGVYQNFDNGLRNDFIRILSAFAIILGLVSLMRVHHDKIKRKRENWQYSYVLIVGFAVSGVIGLLGGIEGEMFLPTTIAGFHFDIQTLYLNIMVPLGSTMFALLAFFMASASYRAFRARSLESSLLLSAAFVIMIGVLPLADKISTHLPSFAQWIMDIPNVAAKRGITFGIALGGIATSLKIILGIERSWLGGKE